MNYDNDNDADLLMGAPAIAKFLGIGARVLYRLADEGHLPVFKLGGTLSARKSGLRKHLAQLEKSA